MLKILWLFSCDVTRALLLFQWFQDAKSTSTHYGHRHPVCAVFTGWALLFVASCGKWTAMLGWLNRWKQTSTWGVAAVSNLRAHSAQLKNRPGLLQWFPLLTRFPKALDCQNKSRREPRQLSCFMFYLRRDSFNLPIISHCWKNNHYFVELKCNILGLNPSSMTMKSMAKKRVTI